MSEEEVPTTPVMKTGGKGIHQLSMFDSPPILYKNLDTPNGKLYPNSDDMKVNMSASHMKGHPHGLSTKKRSSTSNSISNSNAVPVLELNFNHSIDYGRNNESSSFEEQNRENVDIKNGISDKNNLEEVDINKMFNVDNEKPVILNHSPIKLEISSPVKSDQRVDEPPSKKLKLDFVPNLKQADEARDEDNLASPVAIEMINNNIETSPPTNVDRQEMGEEKGEEENNNQLEEEESFLSSHKLTPVHQRSPDSPRMTTRFTESNRLSTIDTVTQRNDELSDELNHVNKRMNSMIASYEKLNEEHCELNLKLQALNDEEEKHREEVSELTLIQEKISQRNDALKTRLKEAKSEISMLNSNQKLLQEKYDHICFENENAVKEKEHAESELQNIKKELELKQNQLDELASEKVSVEASITSLKTELTTLTTINDELNNKSSTTAIELEQKCNEILKLKEKLEELVNTEKDTSKELIDKISALTNDKQALEEKLNIVKSENDQLTAIRNSIKEETDTRLQSLNDELSRCKEEIQRLKVSLEQKSIELESLQKKYEEVNDDATVRTAEVKELNEEIIVLKESNSQLESNTVKLEEQIHNWESKYNGKTEELQKLTIDYESSQGRNNNMEALTELEEVHNTMTSLESALKKNADTINHLRTENEELKNKVSEITERAQKHINEKEHGDGLNNAIDSESLRIEKEKLETQNIEKSKEIQTLLKQIDDWRQKLELKDTDTNKRLKLLAEDLYVQYSSKHEQKVKLLKKGYESKYQGEIDKLSFQNKTLNQELEQLNNKLASERKEKQELLRILEEKE